MDLLQASVKEIRDAVRTKKIKAIDVAQFFLDRSNRLNPKLNAFITLNDKVLEEAKAIDAKIARGEDPGVLAGVPIAIKDMLCTKGLKTTAASKILFNFIPPYSATVVEKLQAAGAVILGKANQDEFAMGSSNENSAYGNVKNPWDLTRVPGGSSGGSAAAVAARMVPAAIGTDTGGSIRQPASFCGIAGIKPTYGRVSRYGIVAFASSLDQAGPMANSSEDCALLLEVISGRDDKDSTSASQTVPNWSEQKASDLKGLTIGLPKEYFSDAIDKDVRDVVESTKAILQKAGATFKEVSLPHTEFGISVYYLIATSEASSNLARYDGVRYGLRATNATNLETLYTESRGQGFGSEVKRRIMLGTYALSSGYYDAYYQKACQIRRLLQQDFLKAFESCQILLSPVTTSPAYKIGEKTSDPLKMYLDDIFTTSTNLAGLPGMSVPAGFSKDGMPVGVQLTATHFDEASIFKVAQVIEKGQNAAARRPNEH